MELAHLPVMAAEVVEYLVTRTDGTYVDGTLGAGGHGYRILNNAPAGRLLGIDLDGDALEEARQMLAAFGERVMLAQGNFADLGRIASDLGISSVDGVLLDLGFSSLQLDDPERGFSFAASGPIDMRLDRTARRNALDVIAESSERDLARLIGEYGEERRAHPIARAILAARDDGRLATRRTSRPRS